MTGPAPSCPCGGSVPCSLLLTPDEVGLVLRTTRKAVYAMIERGQLPGVRRVGRRLLVHRAELLQWLDHNCAPSPKGAGR
jgi:excisionase family DNA binding protein